MNYCNKCNNKVNPNDKYCEECGAQLIFTKDQEENTIKADVKIDHTNRTIEKILKGLADSVLSAFNSVKSRFLLLKRRLIKPVILLLIVGGISIVAISGLKYYYTEIYFELQTEFYGISLLDEKSDILLIKGVPDKEEKEIWGYKLSSKGQYGRSVVIDHGWLLISFKQDIAKKIFITRGYGKEFMNDNMFLKLYSFFDNSSSYDQKFYPYRHNYSEILKRFGEPSMNSISDDKLTRTITYNDLNIFFTFEQNKVTSYGLYESEF